MTDKAIQEMAKSIKQHRKKSGLTQVALAKKAGIQPNTLARLERGEHRPSLPTLEKLAKALNIKLQIF
jgi:transcriptional regulator with XRE-family HTH domain